MSSRARLAFPPDGHVIVTCDGPEVLVYAGDDERPLWRATCETPLVSVGATKREVVAVDEAGALTRWDCATGGVLQQTALGAAPVAFALAANGTALVARAADVAVVGRSAAVRTLVAPEVSAVAVDGLCTRVALAMGSRVRVHAIDGEVLAAADFGDPVRAVAWHPGGFWLAAAGDRLYRLEPDGSGRENVARVEGAIDLIACAADGATLALRTGARSAVMIEHPSGAAAGHVQYVDRALTGLAFGPAPWLAVGIDGGDANKINLHSGAVHRTDPHPGRTRTSWMLAVSTGRERVAPRAAPPAASPTSDEPSEHGGGMSWHSWLGLGLTLLGLLRACSEL